MIDVMVLLDSSDRGGGWYCQFYHGGVTRNKIMSTICPAHDCLEYCLVPGKQDHTSTYFPKCEIKQGVFFSQPMFIRLIKGYSCSNIDVI